MSGFATSDEDELSVLPVATPARSYTRSESDDDDEDDAPPRDATRRSRSYQASDKRSLHPRHLADPLDHLTPRKSIETTGYSNRRLVTRRRSHHVTKRRSSSESFSESAQLAKIEVALPWLPREYRAAFRYVRVPPSDGLEEEDFDVSLLVLDFCPFPFSCFFLLGAGLFLRPGPAGSSQIACLKQGALPSLNPSPSPLLQGERIQYNKPEKLMQAHCFLAVMSLSILETGCSSFGSYRTAHVAQERRGYCALCHLTSENSVWHASQSVRSVSIYYHRVDSSV